nr:hypothetical protein [Phragmitibacter flavus]
MQRNDGIFSVLGRGGASLQIRRLGIQMKVVPFKALHFSTPQAGENRHQINDFTATGCGKQADEFLVRECAPGTNLFPVALHFLDVLERIAFNALMAFHPVEE